MKVMVVLMNVNDAGYVRIMLMCDEDDGMIDEDNSCNSENMIVCW